ncbi:hypothetical protein [Vallicoccus soli]|uniref:hypothetical protein n=1 Tax=Vallicoccus soli TaxID=2339232 RepID=UPI00140201BB|nr:hypothetical protein [Vallicoccus soli]
MASLFAKVQKFAQSPQGRKLIGEATRKAQQAAQDPRNRERIEQVRRRFTGKP